MKYRITYFLFLLYLKCFSQVNLIPNYSFENYSQCPFSFGLFGLCNSWVNPCNSTPDYYNDCSAISSGASVPLNNIGYQKAKSGSAYAGIFIYGIMTDTNKLGLEFIQAPLINPLEKNKCYYFEMYYSLSNASGRATNRLEAYLSTNQFTTSLGQSNNNVNPQFYVDTTTYITDTLNWKKLSGYYIANGGESYLTLGNFKDKLHTKQIKVTGKYVSPWIFPDSNFCYVYIDDVSLYEIPKPNLGGDKSVCLQNNTLIIGDATLPNHSLQWHRNDTLLSDTNNVISIHPNYTSTYILQNQGCAVDTIVINVLTNCPTPADPVPNTFTPNDDGINDAWVFSVGSASTKVSCRVYNRWGNLIYQLPNTTPPHTTIHWDGRTNSGEKCSEGVYFYTIEYTNADGEKVREKGYVSLFK